MRFLVITLGFLLSFPVFAIERKITITPRGDMTNTVRWEIYGNYESDQDLVKLLELEVQELEFLLEVDRCKFFYIQAKACTDVDCTELGAVYKIPPKCVKSEPPTLDGIQ